MDFPHWFGCACSCPATCCFEGQAFCGLRVNPLIAVAHAQIDRLVLLRHRAVHEALADAAGARELQQVALFALDAIFQTLPLWLGGPGC